MKEIARRLNAYIQKHPFDSDESDCETVLDQLYRAYTESHERDPVEIGDGFKELEEFLCVSARCRMGCFHYGTHRASPGWNPHPRNLVGAVRYRFSAIQSIFSCSSPPRLVVMLTLDSLLCKLYFRPAPVFFFGTGRFFIYRNSSSTRYRPEP